MIQMKRDVLTKFRMCRSAEKRVLMPVKHFIRKERGIDVR